MNRTWKHCVIRAELPYVLEPLHGWSADHKPADGWESDLTIDDVVDSLSLECTYRIVGLLSLLFLHDKETVQ